MPEESDTPQKTAHTALIEALERVDEMQHVLVIWEKKDSSGMGSIDSDLTISECLYFIEMFKHWLLSHALEKD